MHRHIFNDGTTGLIAKKLRESKEPTGSRGTVKIFVSDERLPQTREGCLSVTSSPRKG